MPDRSSSCSLLHPDCPSPTDTYSAPAAAGYFTSAYTVLHTSYCEQLKASLKRAVHCIDIAMSESGCQLPPTTSAFAQPRASSNLCINCHQSIFPLRSTQVSDADSSPLLPHLDKTRYAYHQYQAGECPVLSTHILLWYVWRRHQEALLGTLAIHCPPSTSHSLRSLLRSTSLIDPVQVHAHSL